MGLLNTKLWNEMLEVTHQVPPTPKERVSQSEAAIHLERAVTQDVEGTPNHQQCEDPRSPTVGIYRTPILTNCSISNDATKEKSMKEFDKWNESSINPLLSSTEDLHSDVADSEDTNSKICLQKTLPLRLDSEKENRNVTPTNSRKNSHPRKPLSGTPLSVINRDVSSYKPSMRQVLLKQKACAVDKENAQSPAANQ